MDNETDKQFDLLMWGVENVITKEDFRDKLREGRPLKIKLGVDPTAPDIHLGHTVVLRKMRQFQDLGHEAVLIIGGFTSQIGDPSGKSKTRPPLTKEEIGKNSATYLEQVYKILSGERLSIVDNSSWLDSLTLKETLKLLSMATMSKLLEHNTFKERFNDSGSIRMHEFIYPFMQAYDSIHLKSDIELGGSDQLFNIAFGRELQKEFNQKSQCALLLPILTGTDGQQKMSKSLNNYIGVTDSPKVMSQKLLNMPDSNIISYFKLLTSVSKEEVETIGNELAGKPETDIILKHKHRLIKEILSIYHPETNEQAVDVLKIQPSECTSGSLNILKALSVSGFAKSNREAKELLGSGSVRINGEKISDWNFMINLNNGKCQLNVGKKKFITLSL